MMQHLKVIVDAVCDQTMSSLTTDACGMSDGSAAGPSTPCTDLMILPKYHLHYHHQHHHQFVTSTWQ